MINDYEQTVLDAAMDAFWCAYDDLHKWQSLEDCARQAILVAIRIVTEDVYFTEDMY